MKPASNPPLQPIFPNTINLHQVSRGVAHLLAEGEEASKPEDPQTAEDMSLRRALKVSSIVDSSPTRLTVPFVGPQRRGSM